MQCVENLGIEKNWFEPVLAREIATFGKWCLQIEAKILFSM